MKNKKLSFFHKMLTIYNDLIKSLQIINKKKDRKNRRQILFIR